MNKVLVLVLADTDTKEALCRVVNAMQDEGETSCSAGLARP